MFNSCIHNFEKWLKILQKSCGVHTTKCLKCVWSFFNIMNERAKQTAVKIIVTTLHIFGIRGNVCLTKSEEADN